MYKNIDSLIKDKCISIDYIWYLHETDVLIHSDSVEKDLELIDIVTKTCVNFNFKYTLINRVEYGYISFTICDVSEKTVKSAINETLGKINVD